MFKPFLSLSVVAALLTFATAATVHAQDVTPPPSKLSRVIEHMDFALQGTGAFTKSVHGTTYDGTEITQTPSNTFGGLFTIRATKNPWVGAELNIGIQRFTQSYTCCNLQGGAQANTTEYTLGYVVHPPHRFFGIKPSFAAGSGVLAFRPTTFGGQGLREQARQTYYYAVDGDLPLSRFFAIRAGFRQQFYLAPDFGQNYLTILKHTITSQPAIGFAFKF